MTSDRQPAERTVDASGLLVMPGMVDAHVHFMDPAAPEREDFPTGTAAAARAGVTTVIEHTYAGPLLEAADLDRKREYLRDRSRVDFAPAAHASPDRLDEVELLWRAGVAFVKTFTCTTHGVPGFDSAQLRELFDRAARCGAVCLVHCEDEALTAQAERALRDAGREDGGAIPAWRNRDAELAALAVTALLARRTGARVIAAHVSHFEALEVVLRERRLGADLAIETCPQYLTLLEEEILEHGAFRKFTPPARAQSTARPRDDVARGARPRRRLHSNRPCAGDRRAKAQGLDLGRPLRPPGDRHDAVRAARRRPPRLPELRARGRGLLRSSGADLRACAAQGPARSRSRCRSRARRPRGALAGARRGRRLPRGLVALFRPHV